MSPQNDATQEQQYKSVHQAKMAGLLSQTDFEGLKRLIEMGVPVASLAPRRNGRPGDDVIWTAANNAAPSWQRFRNHTTDNAIIAIAGPVLEWIDVDVKNGGIGMETFKKLEHLIDNEIARVATPSGGLHVLVPATGCAAVSCLDVDYLANHKKAFLPGSKRQKYPGGSYTWLALPEWKGQQPNDAFPLALAELRRKSKPAAAPKSPKKTVARHSSQLYGGRGIGQWAYKQVADAKENTRHNRLLEMAITLGATAGDDWQAHTAIEVMLLEASYVNGYAQEHGLRNTLVTIRDGIRFGIDDQAKQA